MLSAARRALRLVRGVQLGEVGGKMKRDGFVRAAMAAAAALALAYGGGAAAQPAPAYEYAAKAVCGKMDRGTRGPFAGGRYYTVVNIHNPRGVAHVRRKVAQAGEARPGRISGFESHALGADEAMAIDCRQIQEQAGSDRIDGFVVVQSSHELDIVAVYTAAGEDEHVTSFHTERVPMRKMR